MNDTVVHGLYDETSAPHIISVGFAGVRSEVLLHALEDKGYLCIRRVLRAHQTILLGQRSAERNRCGARIFGCDDPLQYVRD